MRRVLTLGFAVLALLMTTNQVPAQLIIIDDFEDGTPHSVSVSGTGSDFDTKDVSTDGVNVPTVLGGFRLLEIDVQNNPQPTTSEIVVAAGFASTNSAATADALAAFTYDNDGFGLVAAGDGDLSAGFAFEIDITVDVAGGVDFVIELVDIANNLATSSFHVNPGDPLTQQILFSSFLGIIDFGNIDVIRLVVNPDQVTNAADATIDNFVVQLVPEPTSLGIFTLAVLSAGGTYLARRRKQSSPVG